MVFIIPIVLFSLLLNVVFLLVYLKNKGFYKNVRKEFDLRKFKVE